MRGLHPALSYPGQPQLCWEGRACKISMQENTKQKKGVSTTRKQTIHGGLSSANRIKLLARQKIPFPSSNPTHFQ